MKVMNLSRQKDAAEKKLKSIEQAIVKAQADRRKKRLQLKLHKLSHLKNVAKEVALFKKAKGIPHPSTLNSTKYKAVTTQHAHSVCYSCIDRCQQDSWTSNSSLRRRNMYRR